VLGVADVLNHTAPHRLHIRDEAGSFGRRPYQRLHGACVALAQGAVSGDRPSLEQSLELPGLGPPPVVLEMTRQCSDQRAGPAFGAKSSVDRPNRSFGRVIRAGAQHSRPPLAANPQRLVLAIPIDRLGNEHHVYAPDIVELATTP